MCDVHTRVQPQEAHAQLSKWLHNRAVSQERKIHVWPETKKGERYGTMLSACNSVYLD